MLGKAEDKIQSAIREIVSESIQRIQQAQHNIQWRIFSQIITVLQQLRTSLSIRLTVTFLQRTLLLANLVAFKLISN